MWRWYTARDRREAIGTIAVLALVGVVLVPIGLLVAGAMVAAAGGLQVRGFGAWTEALLGLLRAPSDPGAAFGAPMPAGLFWGTAVLILVVVVGGWVFLARELWRALGPTGEGFATRTEVAKELSAAACRRKAKTTRPDLNRRQRIIAKTTEIGIPLHRMAVTRTHMWLPLENASGVIAPQQSGKSMMDLIHKALAAPAGMVCTSTKPELFLLTAMARERAGSQVTVLDLTGTVKWWRKVRWSPVRGCTTVAVAHRRAKALVAATSSDDGSSGGGNHRFFERRAVAVMEAMLLAAEIAQVDDRRFIEWCQNDSETEPTEILRTRPAFAAQARALEQAQAVVPETRSGIWETLRDAIACLTDPEIAAAALPRPGEASFDPTALVREKGSLYVIGSERNAGASAPLITAFVSEVLEAAKTLALEDAEATGRERLAPPFSAVLDELASVPLPDLPTSISDSAGRGILIHWAIQSEAQAEARWGKEGAQTLFDNTTALTIFGGLKAETTLKWASLLVGRRVDERRSRHTNGFLDASRTQVSEDRTDTLEPAEIRKIPRGRALLIVRSTPALIVELLPAWKRRDWKTLTADRDELRAGQHAEPPPIEQGRLEPAREPALTGGPHG